MVSGGAQREAHLRTALCAAFIMLTWRDFDEEFRFYRVPCSSLLFWHWHSCYPLRKVECPKWLFVEVVVVVFSTTIPRFHLNFSCCNWLDCGSLSDWTTTLWTLSFPVYEWNLALSKGLRTVYSKFWCEVGALLWGGSGGFLVNPGRSRPTTKISCI